MLSQAQLSSALYKGERESSSGSTARGRRRNNSTAFDRRYATATNAAQYGSAVVGAHSSLSMTSSTDRYDEVSEDEKMVEDLLMSQSPQNPSSNFASPPIPGSPMSCSDQMPINIGSFQSALDTSLDAQTSQFATTDPFYLAQLQAAQQNTSPQSVFFQSGIISASSPFVPPRNHIETREWELAQPFRADNVFS